MHEDWCEEAGLDLISSQPINSPSAHSRLGPVGEKAPFVGLKDQWHTGHHPTPHPSFTSNPSNILCVAHLTQYLFMCSRCVLKRNREVKFPEDFSLMIQLIDSNPAVSAFFDAAIMILPVVLDIHRWVSRPRLACHVLPHEHKPLGSRNHFRLFLTRSDLNYCWVHLKMNDRIWIFILISNIVFKWGSLLYFTFFG